MAPRPGPRPKCGSSSPSSSNRSPQIPKAIYTLPNQGTNSELQYNYVHDYSCSQWADYGFNGLYLDEKTSGYTVAHNVLTNCPTNVAQNQVGTNAITDNGANPQGAQNTIATAGIESTYTDIETLTVPAAKF